MGLWSLKGKKILIVDDFAEMRSTIRGMLVPYGADDISMASNGEEAVDIICQNNFDIILCDYNLGDGKDGQQVLEEVKLRDKLAYSTVFIMVTAENTSFMVMGALEYQPDDYLSKPFTHSVLQNRIKKLLDKKGDLKKLAKALDQHNNTTAIALCTEEINNKPRHRHEFLKLKCELLINEHRYDEATELCQQVMTERNLPWAKFSFGKILFLQQAYEDAKQIFEELIQENAAYISAYDWLAKCQQIQGQTEASQKTIEMAIERSPKSVLRQRTLADLAEQNNNLSIAERARKKTLRTAKNSILCQSSDYTKLANVLTANDNSKEALRIVDQLKHDFKNDSEAKLAASVSKGKIYSQIGRESESRAAIDEAAELFSKNQSHLSKELAIELTEAFLANGKADIADKLVTQLITNNHDNQELLDKVSQIYKDADSDNNVNQIVTAIRQEIIDTNNKGVKLLENGKLEESVALFEQALERGPENQAININSAQAYIMLIKQRGSKPPLLAKVRRCLDKTSNNEKLRKRHQLLNKAYWDIVNKMHEG